MPPIFPDMFQSRPVTQTDFSKSSNPLFNALHVSAPMAWYVIDWNSIPLYSSIAFSCLSTCGIKFFFGQLGPRISVLRRSILALIAISNEIISASLFIIALRDQPVFDYGFIITYLLPVLLFIFTSSLFLATTFAFLFSDFTSPGTVREFLPAILIGNLYEVAYALAYGSFGGFLLLFCGIVENFVKLAVMNAEGQQGEKVD
jgi:hypothetical protein